MVVLLLAARQIEIWSQMEASWVRRANQRSVEVTFGQNPMRSGSSSNSPATKGSFFVTLSLRLFYSAQLAHALLLEEGHQLTVPKLEPDQVGSGRIFGTGRVSHKPDLTRPDPVSRSGLAC